MSEQNEHNRHVEPVQAGEIARLKALTDNPDGGVTVMGREERAVHAVLTMATVLYGALEDLMWGAECPKNLDRLLDRMEHIIGMIRGTVCAPAEENAVLLLLDCEAALAIIKKARGVESEYGEASINRCNAAMHRLKEAAEISQLRS